MGADGGIVACVAALYLTPCRVVDELLPESQRDKIRIRSHVVREGNKISLCIIYSGLTMVPLFQSMSTKILKELT